MDKLIKNKKYDFIKFNFLEKYHGFSLIELIAFMVAMGVLGTGLLVGMNQAQRGSGIPRSISEASFLANARMQIILMNRKIQGFATLNDPCITSPTTAICQPLVVYASSNNFQVSSTISSTDATTKMIKVTVTGAGNATISASVSNYGNN